MQLLFHRTTGMQTTERGTIERVVARRGVKTREARFVERNVDYTTRRRDRFENHSTIAIESQPAAVVPFNLNI